jgi:hypothetical protein
VDFQPQQQGQLQAHLSSLDTRAAELAQYATAELQQLRQRVQQRGVQLPWKRFQEGYIEFARYAGTHGLFRAQTPEARQHALDAAVEAIANTSQWLQQYHFMSPEEMKRWSHLVRWEGTDKAGHPVMLIRIGQALKECRGRAAADQVANAIISQTEYAVQHMLGNEAPQPERMVVVMDCRGAKAYQVTRLVRMMKSVALTLNHHYPARLHQLFFVEPPAVLRWPLQASLPLLHPQTGSKLRLCQLDDPSVPIKL